jgi:predicted TIM-barrel fold metal-dependent hydrolase
MTMLRRDESDAPTTVPRPDDAEDDRVRTSYALISGDSHVNEPPDLWTSRLASKFAERAPRMESFEQGDAWVLEGSPEPVSFGRNAGAGLGVWSPDPWMRWADVRPGAWNPAARLEEQNLEGVDAEILYPTPRMARMMVSNPDREFHRALITAYNDWLSEYCSYAPDRLVGVGLLPNSGVDDAVRECERVVSMPGIRSVTIGAYPHGDLDISPDDDLLWAAIQAADVPLSLHVGLDNTPPGAHHQTLREGIVRMRDTLVRLEEFIYTGMMRRFPRLQIVFAEVDGGWVPFWKEQAYNRWRRENPKRRVARGLVDPPTACMDRISYTYITDHYAIRNLDLVGVEQLMWSNDYAHTASDYPFSWRTIEADFCGVADDKKHLVLAGNAQRVYRLP